MVVAWSRSHPLFLILLPLFLSHARLEKSLRILIETAKHVQVPSYETLCEAVFGRFGFLFISLNMFFLSYGAMMSYLMIVKDTFGSVLGLELLFQRRALLFCISLLIIVPLASLRDMADLAQTSRFNVLIDFCMVMIVIYVAPMSEQVEAHGGILPVITNSLVPQWNTVFVGLGVLSFAFVCQHSAFIIAGSLQQPTRQRWKHVTRTALIFCACLAILCGTTGYLGYLDQTKGNILNNLQSNPILSNTARTLLGTTMLFVYPMESFVARHVCVVLLFQGRRAHEGEDAAILSRRDRRITLTVSLYLMALLPAMLFENLGKVLAATGAVGGSCISYIGVGAVYLGVYGADFLRMMEPWHDDIMDLESWWNKGKTTATGKVKVPGKVINGGGDVEESTPLKEGTTPPEEESTTPSASSSWLCYSQMRTFLKTIGWYMCAMPLWCWLATIGKNNLILHRQEMAGKSPHISRIDSQMIKHQPPRRHRPMADIQEEDDDREGNRLVGRDVEGFTLHSSARGNTKSKIVVRSNSDFVPGSGTILPPKSGLLAPSYHQQQVTPKRPTAAKKVEEEPTEAEEHAEDHTPTCRDFVIAIGYILFGVVALIVGLLSLAYSDPNSGGGR